MRKPLQELIKMLVDELADPIAYDYMLLTNILDYFEIEYLDCKIGDAEIKIKTP